MCIKILYNITTFIWVYSNIKQQSSSMQNHKYFCKNLIDEYTTTITDAYNNLMQRASKNEFFCCWAKGETYNCLDDVRVRKNYQ